MRRIQLRKSHPNMFRGALALAIVLMALGANFFLFTPTFNQYRLSTTMGYVFGALGAIQAVALATRRAHLLRASMASIVTTTAFYGSALVVYWAQTGKTSLQLPITYFGLSILQLTLLIEPTRNPLSEKRDDDRPR